jgi:hypothetical protein
VSARVSDVEPVFRAVRQACSAATWSRGVELARAEAVTGERDDGDEVVLRVSTRGGLLCPTALLYLDDAEWECDCGTRDDVCEHVAAAVIALRRARSAGEPLPRGDRSVGRIGYRLRRVGRTLHFERVVVGDDDETPLAATLVAVSSGRVSGPAFLATQEDLAVERVLGASRQGALPRGVWTSLLPALAACPDVQLDGRPVRASGERVGLVGRLEDEGTGFVLRALRDPRIAEVFDDDVVQLEDDTLCLLGGSPLTGREREELGRGRIFRADQVAELVSEVLPSLSGRLHGGGADGAAPAHPPGAAAHRDRGGARRRRAPRPADPRVRRPADGAGGRGAPRPARWAPAAARRGRRARADPAPPAGARAAARPEGERPGRGGGGARRSHPPLRRRGARRRARALPPRAPARAPLRRRRRRLLAALRAAGRAPRRARGRSGAGAARVAGG